MSRNVGAPNRSISRTKAFTTSGVAAPVATKFGFNTDFDPRNPKKGETLKANQSLVELLTSIAVEKQAAPAQIALAWLLAQNPWLVPTPGPTTPVRLDESLGALKVELIAGDLRNIDSATVRIKIEGARYPDKLEALTGH